MTEDDREYFSAILALPNKAARKKFSVVFNTEVEDAAFDATLSKLINDAVRDRQDVITVPTKTAIALALRTGKRPIGRPQNSDFIDRMKTQVAEMAGDLLQQYKAENQKKPTHLRAKAEDLRLRAATQASKDQLAKPGYTAGGVSPKTIAGLIGRTTPVRPRRPKKPGA